MGHRIDVELTFVDTGASVTLALSPRDSSRPSYSESASFNLSFLAGRDRAPLEPEARAILEQAMALIRANDPGGLAVPSQSESGSIADGATFPWEIEWVPRLRVVLGFLALFFLACLVREGTGAIGDVPRPRWAIPGLAGIALLAGALRFTLSPHAFLHELYHHASALPQFLSLPQFQTIYGETAPSIYRAAFFLPDDERRVFAINALLAALTVPVTALLDLSLFRRWDRALFTAFVLALLPLHLRFSASEDAVVPATLFAVASLFLLLRFVDTGGRIALAGLVCALALGMQSRPEMLAFPLFMLAFLALVRGRKGLLAILRSSGLIAMAVLALLLVPRALALFTGADDVLPMLARGGDRSWTDAGWVRAFTVPRTHAFLHQNAMPVFLAILVGLGVVATGIRAPRILTGILLCALASVMMSPGGYDNLPSILRIQVAATPFWALLAGGVLPLLVDGTARRRKAVRLVAIGLPVLVVVAAVVARADFISRPPEAHLEWEFLAKTIPDLPRDARILTIMRPAGRDLNQFPEVLVARAGRSDLRLLDLRATLDRAENQGSKAFPPPGPGLLFYQGMYCHFAFHDEPTPDPMHERCIAVMRHYELEPLVTRTLDGPPSSELRYSGNDPGPWEVGFFKVTGVR
jgi:hypothetical protein